MAPSPQTIRLGLSTRRLTRAGGAPVEGIAVYTRALQDKFSSGDDVVVRPVVGFGSSDRADVESRVGALSLPLSFATSAAMSIATRRPFPGSHALSKAIDLYHATDYWIPKLSIPVVATLHDAIPLSHPQWGSPRNRMLKNALLRTSAQWADAVITVSHAMVEPIVEHFGISRDRVHVVHNGVEDEWYRPVSDQAVEAALAPKNLARGYFLTVGTLQPRKNLERLLEAHRTLPAAIRRAHPLVIVGREGWGVDQLKAELAAEERTNTARWLRDVEHDQLRAIFAGAHALAYPSLYEGFGLPILEAFASGVPVITSNVAAMPEIAGDAAVLVDPTNVRQIATALLGTINDLSLTDRLSVAGRDRARLFSWSDCARRTVAVYREVMEDRDRVSIARETGTKR